MTARQSNENIIGHNYLHSDVKVTIRIFYSQSYICLKLGVYAKWGRACFIYVFLGIPHTEEGTCTQTNTDTLILLPHVFRADNPRLPKPNNFMCVPHELKFSFYAPQDHSPHIYAKNLKVKNSCNPSLVILNININ